MASVFNSTNKTPDERVFERNWQIEIIYTKKTVFKHLYYLT